MTGHIMARTIAAALSVAGLNALGLSVARLSLAGRERMAGR